MTRLFFGKLPSLALSIRQLPTVLCIGLPSSFPSPLSEIYSLHYLTIMSAGVILVQVLFKQVL